MERELYLLRTYNTSPPDNRHATVPPGWVQTDDLAPRVVFNFPWHELYLGSEMVGMAYHRYQGEQTLAALAAEVARVRAEVA